MLDETIDTMYYMYMCIQLCVCMYPSDVFFPSRVDACVIKVCDVSSVMLHGTVHSLRV